MNKLFKQIAGVAFATTLGFGFAQQAKAVEVQEVISDGGIRAWLIEDHMNPLMTMDIALPVQGRQLIPMASLAWPIWYRA